MGTLFVILARWGGRRTAAACNAKLASYTQSCASEVNLRSVEFADGLKISGNW